MTNIPDLIRRLQRAVSDGTSLSSSVASSIEASDLMEEAAEELAELFAKTQPCKTCQWWNDGYGTLTTGWKYCDRGGSDDGEPEVADTLAWAADVESYGASLLTHETFGCCMHQPREAT